MKSSCVGDVLNLMESMCFIHIQCITHQNTLDVRICEPLWNTGLPIVSTVPVAFQLFQCTNLQLNVSQYCDHSCCRHIEIYVPTKKKLYSGHV